RDTDNPGKIDWKAGSIISPPYFWYHQHFNTGDTKARYWAITEGDFPKRLGIPLDVEQIEAPQEDPAIKKRFERELGRQMVGAILPNPGLHHDHHHDHDHHDGDDHHNACPSPRPAARRLRPLRPRTAPRPLPRPLPRAPPPRPPAP